jgi:hypothetical protein
MPTAFNGRGTLGVADLTRAEDVFAMLQNGHLANQPI